MKERSVDFYFFSGTGNTLLAARAVARGLREGGKTVRLRRLEKGFLPFQDDRTALGIAVTVAMFSTYPFAWEFLESLPDGQGRGAFLISTMGGASGGLRPAVKKLLLSKNFTPWGSGFVKPSSSTTNNPRVEQEKNRIKEKNASAFSRRPPGGKRPVRSISFPSSSTSLCSMAMVANEGQVSPRRGQGEVHKAASAPGSARRRTSAWRSIPSSWTPASPASGASLSVRPRPSACRGRSTDSTGR